MTAIQLEISLKLAAAFFHLWAEQTFRVIYEDLLVKHGVIVTPPMIQEIVSQMTKGRNIAGAVSAPEIDIEGDITYVSETGRTRWCVNQKGTVTAVISRRGGKDVLFATIRTDHFVEDCADTSEGVPIHTRHYRALVDVFRALGFLDAHIPCWIRDGATGEDAGDYQVSAVDPATAAIANGTTEWLGAKGIIASDDTIGGEAGSPVRL